MSKPIFPGRICNRFSKPTQCNTISKVQEAFKGYKLTFLQGKTFFAFFSKKENATFIHARVQPINALLLG